MLAQKYIEHVKKLVERHLTNHFQIPKYTSTIPYISLIDTFGNTFYEIQRDALIAYLEEIDKEFRNSLNRTKKYHVKKNENRSLTTRFGNIRFKRTVYVHRGTGNTYIHVDRSLGLVKYDLYDPDVKSLLLEYATEYGDARAARIVTDLINKSSNHSIHISRQFVRYVIITSKLSIPKVVIKKDVDILYVMADEKYIHTQGNSNTDIMAKHVVIFDGYHHTKDKRVELTSKHGLVHIGKGIVIKLLNYINSAYNVDKLKTVYVMGDGASWIKTLRENLSFGGNETIYALDKFHFKQALRHISPNEDLMDILKNYILNDYIKEFNIVIESLIQTNQHREETLNKKRYYLLNHKKAIQHTYNHRLSCCMESQISHNIADLFSSRPKGYSPKSLMKRLDLRMLFKNKINIRELYFNNLHSNVTIDLNKSSFDILIFDITREEVFHNLLHLNFITK